MGASSPPAAVLQRARFRETRIPLHPTLAMHIRLFSFLFPSSPIEVRFAVLGSRRGLACDVDEK
eukprot:7857525-Lingulodinium_polyedra.AAC.1